MGIGAIPRNRKRHRDREEAVAGAWFDSAKMLRYHASGTEYDRGDDNDDDDDDDNDDAGCVAVAFELDSSAESCASTMHGRKFDGRVLEARLFVCQSTSLSSSQEIEAAADDVEDFLNSLL
jgi:hypothetical protein